MDHLILKELKKKDTIKKRMWYRKIKYWVDIAKGDFNLWWVWTPSIKSRDHLTMKNWKEGYNEERDITKGNFNFDEFRQL